MVETSRTKIQRFFAGVDTKAGLPKSAAMPLQHPNVIDSIAHDSASDEVVLIMTEPRPWDGTDRRVYELQEKVNAYLSFALDGEMVELLPQLAGKNVRLQLECIEHPDPKTAHFLGLIQQQIGFQNVRFAVCIVPELATTPCDGECQCDGGCDCEGECDNDSGCCGGGGNGGGCGCSR